MIIVEIKDVIEYDGEFIRGIYFLGCAVMALLIGVWMYFVRDVPPIPVCLLQGFLFALWGIVKIRRAKQRLREQTGFSSIEDYRRSIGEDPDA